MGPVTDPMTGRTVPPKDQPKGLWAANQLCDPVQLRSSVEGTTVRMQQWR